MRQILSSAANRFCYFKKQNMRLLFYLQLCEMKHLNPFERKLMDNTL